MIFIFFDIANCFSFNFHLTQKLFHFLILTFQRIQNSNRKTMLQTRKCFRTLLPVAPDSMFSGMSLFVICYDFVMEFFNLLIAIWTT